MNNEIRPHEFIGTVGKPCEVCGKPDLSTHHVYPEPQRSESEWQREFRRRESHERLLKIIGIILGMLLLPTIIVGVGWLAKEPMEWHETGDGTHTGYVTAVGKEGVFWRSWTAWFKTDAQSSQEDTYCVRLNDDLAHELQAFAANRTRVEIHYKTYLAYDWAECNGEEAVITSVRVVQ